MKKLSVQSILINLFFIILALIFILPLMIVVSISFSKESDIYNFGYSLIPKNFTITAYKVLLADLSKIINAYKVSSIVSAIGTILSLFLSAAYAYVISRTEFKLAKFFSFVIVFTMLFGGGLVPYYILVTQYLHLQDTYAVLILALFGNAFYILVLKSYFYSIPDSIIESAYIDGAREITIFTRIVLPLSKPGLATVGLFTMYSYWNDWYNALLFINRATMAPLQYLLQIMMTTIDVLTQNMDKIPGGITGEMLPAETTRMAMVVVAIGPMLLVFMFLQKYFVRSLTLGAVKE